MTNEGSVWQAKEAALRDLVLLALYRRDGIVIDETGHVASRLREYIGIPSSKRNGTYISSVMQKMDQVHLIERRMDDRRTRTYSISLVGTLTVEQIRQFEALEAGNKSRFTGDAQTSDDSSSDLEQLVRECDTAYAALQRAAKESARVTSGGCVALNATGVFLAIGIPRQRGRRIKYYLRLLGLASSQSQVAGDEQLWWWIVSDKSLNCEQLRQLATGDGSYEIAQARRNGTPEAGPVTVRQAEPLTRPAVTPAVLDRKHVAAVQSPVVTADPLTALIDIAERLERENGMLHEQLRTQQVDHEKEVDGLKERIRELERRLGERQQASRRASDVIARLGITPATS
jgi:hypothetical protein